MLGLNSLHNTPSDQTHSYMIKPLDCSMTGVVASRAFNRTHASTAATARQYPADDPVLLSAGAVSARVARAAALGRVELPRPIRRSAAWTLRVRLPALGRHDLRMTAPQVQPLDLEEPDDVVPPADDEQRQDHRNQDTQGFPGHACPLSAIAHDWRNCFPG